MSHRLFSWLSNLEDKMRAIRFVLVVVFIFAIERARARERETALVLRSTLHIYSPLLNPSLRCMFCQVCCTKSSVRTSTCSFSKHMQYWEQFIIASKHAREKAIVADSCALFSASKFRGFANERDSERREKNAHATRESQFLLSLARICHGVMIDRALIDILA